MGKIRAYRCLLASVLVGQAERPTEQVNQRRLKHLKKSDNGRQGDDSLKTDHQPF